MGGPVGVMSTKLVLKAGMLLFAARLDGHAVTATIDPTAAETVITPRLAAYLKLTASEADDKDVRHFHVIGVDHAELRLRRVLVRNLDGPATIVIGQDLLAQMRIRLDFDRGRLRVLDPTEHASTGEGEAIIALRRETSGCLELEAPDQSARVALANPAENTANAPPGAPMDFAGLKLSVSDGTSSGNCGSETRIVTWASFRTTRILIDLPHERLVVDKSGGS